MALKRLLAGARFHIPQPDRVVIAAGRNKLAIGREGHGIDGSAGTSTKKLVLTLPALLVQRLLPVTCDRSSRSLLGPWRAYWI
jgi:hypothetical protein